VTIERQPRTAARTPAQIRADLTGGLATAIAEKGYAASTIADIVARARVSKRTFYEHFADKEECLMALYAGGCGQLMAVLRGAGGPTQPWPERIRLLVSAYLSTLDATPAVTRTLLVEIQAAGPRAYRLRQETQRAFADTLVEIFAAARRANPQLAELSPALAIALVGGINELLLQAVDPYAGTGLALHDTVLHLVSAVLNYRTG
jgi:AcrR family transcriptional regulator